MGNLDACRDWGFSGDYVEAMWLMLQQDEPEDFVIATGLSHSVQELIQVAFDHLGLDWEEYVVSDPKLFRPAEVDYSVVDAKKAKVKLGWQLRVTFEELIKMMGDYDLQMNQKIQDAIKR
jgi:GDPmannose 4,6-dehydratase